MALGLRRLGKPLAGWQYNGSVGEEYDTRANAYWKFRTMSTATAINASAGAMVNRMLGPFPYTSNEVVVLVNGIMQYFGTTDQPRQLVFVAGGPETVAFYFTPNNEPADDDVVTVIF